jgi:hypothetical protein
MKKISVMVGLCMLAAVFVPVAGSGNYSPSNFAVERNLKGFLIADGSPRPPFPPALVADGSPRPPFPPATIDGSPRPPFPPGVSA